jgi:hypothetical protein
LSSPTLVRIPDKPLLSFEHGTFDSVHGTPAHAFEPDRFKSASRIHAVPSCYDGDACTTSASSMGVYAYSQT